MIAAPASYIGATALAMSAEPASERDWETDPVRKASPEQPPLFQATPQATPQTTPRTTPERPRTGSQNVIPFEQVQRQAASRLASQPQSVLVPGSAPADASASKPPAPPRAASRKATPRVGQGNLDFRPNVAQGERILATGVPAQVYGDSRVAPPMRRLTAGAMDVAMVLLGFGVFAASARIAASLMSTETADGLHGSGFGVGNAVWITLAVSLIFLSLFYGLVWALAMRETAGMNWTQLHLVTFDGSPLDGRNRTIRFISAWLSYCSGGLGLLWALADEENLAFHDHISRTFPAEMGSARVLVGQRR